MSFYENGFERTAALCVGVASVAFGSPPAGAIEGAVGLAGLIGFVLGRSTKFGPECARVQRRIRARTLGSYGQLIDTSDGNWQAKADLSAADQALHECLDSCIIDRAKLAGSAVSPRGFPEQAVTVVMEGLSTRRPDLFGEGKEGTLPYRYAADVVRAGTTEAVEDVDYYRRLEPQLHFEMARALGLLLEDTAQVKQSQRHQTELLEKLTEYMGGLQARDRFLERSEKDLNATRADLLGLL